MTAQDEGFFSRWSRRKVQQRAETAPPTSPVEPPLTAAAQPPEPTQSSPSSQAVGPVADAVDSDAPTLSDVQSLTPESDFTRFVGRNVSGDVRNAALKKLFSDPHFNVMDGLDVYIDDYNTPTPLPATVLQKMAQAAYLGLAQSPPEEGAHAARATHMPQPGEGVPHSATDAADGDSVDPPPATTPSSQADGDAPPAPHAAAPLAVTPYAHDEDPDLRLQSHHDLGPPGAEPGLVGHAGGQRRGG